MNVLRCKLVELSNMRYTNDAYINNIGDYHGKSSRLYGQRKKV